jgi:hypothetical protein
MGTARKRAPHPKADHHVSRRSALDAAARLVHQICCVAGSATLIEDARRTGGGQPLGRSIERLDTPALFDWLVKIISYQGISDHAASEYLRKHGSVTWLEISYRLSKKPPCPKLQSYWHFHGCGYRKGDKSCARPDLIARCPLPKHRLRNGRLNQSAYSLYFFLRDVADSGFVEWIDARLSWASLGPERSRLARWREFILGPLRNIFGVADKVLSMALADLLLAAQGGRTHWHELGGSFVAIDTLVHKFFVRTGILKSLDARHRYGPQCYEDAGCTGVLTRIAREIDAKKFNRAYPRFFPRFIQHALWRFCAQDGLAVCNSIKIGDRKNCTNMYCRVFRLCARDKISP